MEDSSEIGRDSFSNLKLEEVLKIQLITVTDKNYKKTHGLVKCILMHSKKSTHFIKL